jgi:hypothetical protein
MVLVMTLIAVHIILVLLVVLEFSTTWLPRVVPLLVNYLSQGLTQPAEWTLV